jgi:glycosyltransferase involved in cell wall biosynthesis
MQPISLIMLVHNEAETIAPVVKDYYEKVIAKIPGSEFIIAEDGSRDGTKEILAQLAKEMPLRLASGNERRGYAKAFRTALALPKNEIIFLSDSGGKHDAEDFWKLYPKIEAADVVIGVKTNREDSRFRRLLTWGYNLVINLYFGSHFHDIDSGFRLVKKSAVAKVLKDEWIFKELIASEFTLRLWGHGAKVAEVPIAYHARVGPSRGLPLKKIPYAIRQALGNFPRLKRALAKLS